MIPTSYVQVNESLGPLQVRLVVPERGYYDLTLRSAVREIRLYQLWYLFRKCQGRDRNPSLSFLQSQCSTVEAEVGRPRLLNLQWKRKLNHWVPKCALPVFLLWLSDPLQWLRIYEFLSSPQLRLMSLVYLDLD